MKTNVNMVNIDGEKLKIRVYASGRSMAEASRTLGFGPNYIANCCARGLMARSSTMLMEKMFGFQLEDYKMEEKKEEEQYSIEPYPDGYRLDLVVKPDRVKVSLYFGEEEIQAAWADVRGDTDLDLLKAISYAAHMMYKFTEQKKLEG